MVWGSGVIPLSYLPAFSYGGSPPAPRSGVQSKRGDIVSNDTSTIRYRASNDEIARLKRLNAKLLAALETAEEVIADAACDGPALSYVRSVIREAKDGS